MAHQGGVAAEALPPAGPQPTAEAAALPHPPSPSSGEPSWQAFDERELKRRCKGDKLAAAVMLILLVVARNRVGVHDTLVQVRSACSGALAAASSVPELEQALQTLTSGFHAHCKGQVHMQQSTQSWS